jgi:hypothetical protein
LRRVGKVKKVERKRVGRVKPTEFIPRIGRIISLELLAKRKSEGAKGGGKG